MAKTGTQLANQMQRTGIITRDNKEDFLKRHGLDKFYEFDGGDLVDRDDMSTTTVRVGNNGAQEDWLLDRIEELGKWKRPVDIDSEYKSLSDEAIKLYHEGKRLSPEKQARYDEIKKQMSNKALKEAGWSDERIAAAEQGIKEKHPDVDKDAKIKETLKKITGKDWTDEMINELRKVF